MKEMYSQPFESSKVNVKKLEEPSSLERRWKEVSAQEKLRNRPISAVSLRTLILTFAEQYLCGEMKRKSSISLLIRDRIASIQIKIAKQLLKL